MNNLLTEGWGPPVAEFRVSGRPAGHIPAVDYRTTAQVAKSGEEVLVLLEQDPARDDEDADVIMLTRDQLRNLLAVVEAA